MALTSIIKNQSKTENHIKKSVKLDDSHNSVLIYERAEDNNDEESTVEESNVDYDDEVTPAVTSVENIQKIVIIIIYVYTNYLNISCSFNESQVSSRDWLIQSIKSLS